MKCVICHQTEEDFINAQNAQIENIIKIINSEIMNLKNTTNYLGEANDYSNLCEYINNENCKVCNQSYSVDDKGYYWCNKYNKSFKIVTKKDGIEEELLKLENEINMLNSRKDAFNRIEEELLKLKNEIDILNSRKGSLRNIKFKEIEIDGNIYDRSYETFNRGYEKFNSIIKKYEDKELANKKITCKICPYCESFVKKIVENIAHE
jgi:hypothetical protein